MGWREEDDTSADAALPVINRLPARAQVEDHLPEEVHWSRKPLAAMSERDWRTIARGYNGPGQVEVYAAKMAEAHKRRVRMYA